MVTSSEANDRLCESERWERLRRMTVRQSIALGEALLTSEIMELAVFPDDDRPVSLALALKRKFDPRAKASFAAMASISTASIWRGPCRSAISPRT